MAGIQIEKYFWISCLIALLCISGMYFNRPYTVFADDNSNRPGWLESETVDLVTNNQGKQLVRVRISGKPISNSVMSSASPSIGITPQSTSNANRLSEVPAFDWCYGSSPTAAAMLFGYYDRNGYSDMYTGPANKGICPLNNQSAWSPGECPLSATHLDLDGLTTNGHVDDYYVTEKSFEDPYWDSVNHMQLWIPHTDADCTADFMGTSQYRRRSNLDGVTTFYFAMSGDPLNDYTGREPSNRDGCHGMRLFAESRGYNVNSNYNQFIYPNPLLGDMITHGFTFADYKAEIKEGRPVLLHIGDYTTLGIGYKDPDSVFMHDTLNHSVHIMTWGGIYMDNTHYGVSVIELEDITPVPPVLLSPDDDEVFPGTSLTFSWNDVPYATGYRLEVNSNPSWRPATRLFYGDVGNVLSKEVSGFQNNGTTYYWRVWAGNDLGWSAPSIYSFVNGTVPQDSMPMPSLSTPYNGENVSGTALTFSWDAVPGAIRYRLEVNSNPSWIPANRLFYEDIGDVLSKEVSGFQNNGTSYYWRVWAGNDTDWSAPSVNSFTN
jgi:hypothetical protein